MKTISLAATAFLLLAGAVDASWMPWMTTATHEAVGGDSASNTTPDCPTDASINAQCLEATLPPWPICLSKTAQEWVEHAKDAATRCCDPLNLGPCQCPVKNGPKFQAKIGPYCDAVNNYCDSDVATVTMESANLRGAFDMEEQIQREEYSP
mmetsp:Transcript_806/g.1447  ORF Transcript_806/g.1447 Transcript_806/m.1447 type:complete len:152 (-) Transcript_806:113-568(-)|eukprot:CAMPEP_0183703894 /NCGR_PEP_ID=MMETSP0737-20130205/1448_1 /TAXON_ID=385413 /ORGANISM="Thalassiosira miniscula, Strain CCMP1093" /LENGTH=151 /DNA_ID=CAMNT_0025930695 /DNA_START=196 /DNA_END=651 /DNA_ORIENTATION=-